MKKQKIPESLYKMEIQQRSDLGRESLHSLQEFSQTAQQQMAPLLSSLLQGSDLVVRIAKQLVDCGGKRIRPVCVLLSASLGNFQEDTAYRAAVAVELLHTATLLHDDVIDEADTRRGMTAARVVFGNTMSILAGDWLLTEAFRQVRRIPHGEVLDRLLDTLEQIVLAESFQFEHRGKLSATAEDYARIIEGKTAALFAWSMWAGGRVGGLSEFFCDALWEAGRQTGLAFQLMDDVLDFVGDTASLGKPILADLREGKMTYPLLIACRKDPSLLAWLQQQLLRYEEVDVCALGNTVKQHVHLHGGVHASQLLAQSHVEQAIQALSTFPCTPARAALQTIAEQLTQRVS